MRSFPDITYGGYPCNDDCRKRGYDYFWCHTSNGWGYCTPKHLLQSLKTGSGATDKTPEYDYPGSGIDNNVYSGIDDSPENTNSRGDINGINYDDYNYISSEPDDQDTRGREGSVTGNSEVDFLSKLPANVTVRDIRAFTVYGEPCSNACANRDGFRYTWCEKITRSSTGTWDDSDYCTNEANVTQNGEECLDGCERRGYDYYWCHKDTTLWGYCTPQYLLDKIVPEAQNRSEQT